MKKRGKKKRAHKSSAKAPVQPPEADVVMPAADPNAFMKVNAASTTDSSITWQASEYIHHHKDGLWYATLVVAMIGVAAISFRYLGDYVLLALIIIMSTAIIIYANRKPRTLHFELDTEGIVIEDREYVFDDFRSFSVMQEGAIFSVELDPLQRFRPPVSIYFAPQDGDQIVGLLSEVLPHEEKDLDLVDRVIKRLRF